MRKVTLFIAVISFLLLQVSLIAVAGDSPAKSSVKRPEAADSKADTPPAINWLKYDEGLKQAKKDNKKLIVEFTAKWCGFCRKMRATTLKDQEIIDMLKQFYVTATIDGESRDSINVDGWLTNGRNLAKEYQIRGYPTYWFLTPEGDKIAPLVGYKSKDDFMNVLDYLKDDLYKTKEFSEFLKDKREGK